MKPTAAAAASKMASASKTPGEGSRTAAAGSGGGVTASAASSSAASDASSLVTAAYLGLYILLSAIVIMFNKWLLSSRYFAFSYPIALTMLHMAFCSSVAFLLVRVLKVVKPVPMTPHIYLTCVLPISATFAASLWFGNSAFLYMSVAFIQMLKALMPVATYLVAVFCATDRLRYDMMLNMAWISGGVALASYGEIHFSLVGTLFQIAGNFSEAFRLVLTQVLLQRRGLSLNPITSLYYVAPCSFVCLSIPWYFIELPQMLLTNAFPSMLYFKGIFFANCACALAINLCIFVVIKRTSAVTFRVVGVVKDWLIIVASSMVFPDATITLLNIVGYLLAFVGVMVYNHIRTRKEEVKLLPQFLRNVTQLSSNKK